MLFNSTEFFALAGVTWIGYWLLRGRSRLWLLLIASYTYYGSFNWRFLSLMLIATAVAFTAARRIEEEADDRSRKRFLHASLFINLGLLGVFKYFDFFIEDFRSLLELFGVEMNEIAIQVVLPVGISFYTFQTLAYTIDVYRRRLRAEHDLLVFATFVSFFPQLAAGPIERGKKLLPQFHNLADRPDVEETILGLKLILLGLVRKIVIADTIAPYAAEALSPTRTEFGVEIATNPSWLTLTIGALAFLIQIYGDFAGYSTIARGLGKLFGFDLTRNFRQPFFSTSQSDWWRRWHVTLMTWFREYVFMPLGGARRTGLAVRNLAIVFLLTGLWHGARWEMVVWGALLGAGVVVEYLIRIGTRRRRTGTGPGRGPSAPPIPIRVLGAVYTVMFISLATMAAAATSLDETTSSWVRILSLSSGDPVSSELIIALTFGLTMLVATDWWELHFDNERMERTEDPVLEAKLRNFRSPAASSLKALGGVALIWSLVGITVVFSAARTAQFWYFQF